MSKKRIVDKKLKKGKFYAVHEGSKHGHPGKLYWKNAQSIKKSPFQGQLAHQPKPVRVPTILRQWGDSLSMASAK